MALVWQLQLLNHLVNVLLHLSLWNTLEAAEEPQVLLHSQCIKQNVCKGGGGWGGGA